MYVSDPTIMVKFYYQLGIVHSVALLETLHPITLQTELVTLLHPILTLHKEFTLFSLGFPENAAFLFFFYSSPRRACTARVTVLGS